jgi:hypothetical protein
MVSLARIRQVDHAGFFVLSVLQKRVAHHERGAHQKLGAWGYPTTSNFENAATSGMMQNSSLYIQRHCLRLLWSVRDNGYGMPQIRHFRNTINYEESNFDLKKIISNMGKIWYT